jgi:hypothetical protein
MHNLIYLVKKSYTMFSTYMIIVNKKLKNKFIQQRQWVCTWKENVMVIKDPNQQLKKNVYQYISNFDQMCVNGYT